MPRVKCSKCNNIEGILKDGIVRHKQRYYCKNCNYHFIIAPLKNKGNQQSKWNNKQTSLKDIAQVAGISITTVSRALNNYPDISLKTRNFIRELATTMNYQPNIVAQSLVNRATHTIGVIIPSLETTIFSTMLSGIHEIASKAGYKVIICVSNEKHETEIANLQALMNNMIDGLLICHTNQTSSFEHLRSHIGKRIPIVQFYRVALDLPVPKILADDILGAQKVTEYLIEKGCRRIAILLGSQSLSISQKRLEGYKNALQKNNIKLDNELLCHIDFSHEMVIMAIENWLKLTPKIDAIISISDKSAVQIIRYLKKKKVIIPKQIRVFGFGNEFVGEFIEPSLSTFDTNTKIVGEEAAKSIIEELITGTQILEPKIVKGKIIIRDSA